jgi:hypothetical protein
MLLTFSQFWNRRLTSSTYQVNNMALKLFRRGSKAPKEPKVEEAKTALKLFRRKSKATEVPTVKEGKKDIVQLVEVRRQSG